jgi:hypothetical protein
MMKPSSMTISVTRIHLAIVILLSLFVSCQPKPEVQLVLEVGVYDGSFGKNDILLVIDHSSADSIKGFYVHNRGQAVEQRLDLAFVKQNNLLMVESPDFKGKIDGHINGTSLKGSLQGTGKFLFFKFWKKKKKVTLQKRDNHKPPVVARYKTPVFNKLNKELDIVYGKASGYWTETPYLDDPYISILSRGMVNMMKGEKELDLLLDLYYPEGDPHRLRPLIMLTHGGAFYIGNKQSSTEITLAEAFAKRGYVVASINYRMGFRLRGYDVERSGYKAIQDAHAALRYLSHHAKKYGIDPAHVYVAGNSAGAIASLNVAYLTNNDRPKKHVCHPVGRRPWEY